MSTEPVIETWTALGTRLSTTGKRLTALRAPDGTVKTWTGRASYVVGGRYELRLRREGDSVFMVGTPSYAGMGDDPERAEWEIASEAAERKLRRAAAERKDKRDAGKIDAACKPLCDLAAGLHSFEDVERLVSSVRRRVYDAWGKP